MTAAVTGRPWRRVTATMALRKVADTADVAPRSCSCARGRGGHLTGQVVTVAGGMEGRLLRSP